MNACRHCGRTGRGYRVEPTGYVEWHEWAEKLGRTHEQQRCSTPTCGRFTVWVKRQEAAALGVEGEQPQEDSPPEDRCPDCFGKGFSGQDDRPGLLLDSVRGTDECRTCGGTGVVGEQEPGSP